MKFKLILSAMAVAAIFNSCKKDETKIEEVKAGKIALKFENYAGDEPLVLNTSGYNYVNANADSFNVSVYKYYVSNLKFVTADGTEYHDKNTYLLVDQSRAESLLRTIEGIPPGTYTSIKLLLGVDSTRNVSGVQDGDLDLFYGMFWSWNTGYIMAKVEGAYKQTSNINANYSFHLGGFSGQFSVLHEVALTLPQPLIVTTENTATIALKSDVQKWFYGFTMINFQELNQVGLPGFDARKISFNFSNSISVTSVTN